MHGRERECTFVFERGNWPTGAHSPPCRPRLKYWMEYCEAHPEELSKVAAVQKKVRALAGQAGSSAVEQLSKWGKVQVVV